MCMTRGTKMGTKIKYEALIIWEQVNLYYLTGLAEIDANLRTISLYLTASITLIIAITEKYVGST